MDCGELDELGSLEVVDSTSVYPTGLQSIIDLFVSLPDEEKRETLISYAEQTGKWRPREGESFDLEDIRKDEECADTVGVFLKVSDGDKVRFEVNVSNAMDAGLTVSSDLLKVAVAVKRNSQPGV